ncbi:MAG: ABC transporter permease [Pseudohongiellaceae bacterium]
MFEVALSSLWSRRGSVMLTLMSLTLSMAIVIGVEHVRSQAQGSFVRTVSGVDLLVGARTSQVNLLLYSVFRIGNATNNIKWESYQDIIQRPGVSWSIPISLGDSHRGYRVLGTNLDYFSFFRYGDGELLRFAEGEQFSSSSPLHAVIGSEVAANLNYQVGGEIVLSHGVGNTSFVNHENLPFTISGVLATTGTPVDRTIHISLEGVEAIHLGWQNGIQVAELTPNAIDSRLADLQPSQITSVLLGLDSPMAVFGLQRAINNYPDEPLTAILPAVALGELWQIIGTLENLLQIISVLVLAASLLGLGTMMLSSLRERNRELSLYRAIGANPLFIVGLIELEAFTMMAVAVVAGYFVVVVGGAVTKGWLSETFSLVIDVWPTSQGIWLFMAGALLASMLFALIPSFIAYSRSLGQTLNSH